MLNKKNVKYLILVAVVILLGVWLSRTNWAVVSKYQKAIGAKFLFLPLIFFIPQLLATIGWRLSFINIQREISLPKMFLIRHVGETLAMINPTSVVAGDSFKAYLLKSYSVDLKDSILSLTVSRALLIFSYMVLLIIGSIIFLCYSDIAVKYFLIVTILVFFTLLLAVIRWHLNKNQGITTDVFKVVFYFFRNKKWFAKTYKKLEEVDKDLLIIYNKDHQRLVIIFLLSLVHWVFGGIEFYFILKFIGHDVSLLNAIILESGIILFKAVFAFVPGQIGFEESGNKVMLSLIGLSGNEIWVAVSAIRRARQALWLMTGFVIYRLAFKNS